MNVIAFTGVKRSGKDSAFLIKISQISTFLYHLQPSFEDCVRSTWGGYGISEQDRGIGTCF